MKLGRARVLLVEDDARWREHVRAALVSRGLDVVEQSSEAAERAPHKCDIALSNLSPQSEEGVRLFAALKNAHPDMEILQASGVADNLDTLRILLEQVLQSRSRLEGCVALYRLSRVLLSTLRRANLHRLIVDIASKMLPSASMALVVVGRRGVGAEVRLGRGLAKRDRPLILSLAASTQDAARVRHPADGLPVPPQWAESGFRDALVFRIGTASSSEARVIFLSKEPFSERELSRAEVLVEEFRPTFEAAARYEELDQKIGSLREEQERGAERAVRELARGFGKHRPKEISRAWTMADLDPGVSDIWYAARAIVEELLVQVPDETGVRAKGEDSQNPLIVEVAQAIDECLDGVGRLTHLMRGAIA